MSPVLQSILETYELEHLGPILQRHTLPAIAFGLLKRRTTRSILGGAPLVAADFLWPTYTPKPLVYPDGVAERLGIEVPTTPIARALDFLLQIDLADVRDLPAASLLPRSGLLTFFYDVENQPWGFAPTDKDAFRVVFFEDRDLDRRVPPGATPASMAWAGDARGVVFSAGETLPHVGSLAYDALASEAELPDTYHDVVHDWNESHTGSRRRNGRPATSHSIACLVTLRTCKATCSSRHSSCRTVSTVAIHPATWILALRA